MRMAKISHGNPIRFVQLLGQSVWLDELNRGMFKSGQLARLIDDDGISGLTTNPSIFHKAFAADDAYRSAIEDMRAAGVPGAQAYEHLAVDDIRNAAGRLRRLYENSGAREGLVSMELSPDWAHDADGSVREALRLHTLIACPNVMIKVPATGAGLVVIRKLTALGIHVNATLIFGASQYRKVADAYQSGLEDRIAAGKSLDRITSVASLFVSRIDTLVDRKLAAIDHETKLRRADSLSGQIAVAVARLAYQEYKGMLTSTRWQPLASRHASPQRLLWASTGTKNAAYSDVKYVEELVGRDTIATIPLTTLEAFRNHGKPQPSLESDWLATASKLADLPALSIDLDQIASQLQEEGVAAFAASYSAILKQLQPERARTS